MNKLKVHKDAENDLHGQIDSLQSRLNKATDVLKRFAYGQWRMTNNPIYVDGEWINADEYARRALAELEEK